MHNAEAMQACQDRIFASVLAAAEEAGVEVEIATKSGGKETLKGKEIAAKSASDVEGITVALGIEKYSLKDAAYVYQTNDRALIWEELERRSMIMDVPTDSTHEKKSSTTNWIILKDVTTPKGTVPFGENGDYITRSTDTGSAVIKTIGFADKIQKEAKLFGGAMRVSALQDRTAITELKAMAEQRLLGGNPDIITPVTPNFVETQGATGGALADATYKIKITCLGIYGFVLSQKTGYEGGGVAPNVNDESLPTATSTGTVISGGGGDDKISFSWDPTAAAFSYNVFIDVGGGGYLYQATVGRPEYVLTAIASPAFTNEPPVADFTLDADSWKGIYYQARALGTAGNVQISDLKDLSAFTADGEGGITEINDVLRAGWRATRARPYALYMRESVLKKITSVLIANIPAGLQAVINMAGDEPGTIIGNIRAVKMYHPITGQPIFLVAHPEFPPNKILGLQYDNPYPDPEHPHHFDVEADENFNREMFARTKRTDESGVYFTGTPRAYTGAGFFLWDNCPAASEA